jgi:large subunit ribosomal protein L13
LSSEVKVVAEPEAVVEVKAEGNTIYVDASEQIAGRMCSIVARELLAGKRVVVLNAEKALVSGKTQSVFRQWQTRRPDNILRRMVRGMVPKTKPSGKTAMSRLRVYMGVPEKYVGVKTRKFDDAMARRPIPQYVTIAQISKNIGWND